MKEVLKNDDELWEKIYLTSKKWNVGSKLPEEKFDFHVDNLTENNVYFSNDGIQKQIDLALQINPKRKTVNYFFYTKVKDHK